MGKEAHSSVMNAKIFYHVSHSEYPYTKIGYVYYIYYEGNLIYIGITQRPKIREITHRCSGVLKGKRPYRFVVKGPYELDKCYRKEAKDIIKHSHSIHLINKMKRPNAKEICPPNNR